jgi:hypothetical protein
MRAAFTNHNTDAPKATRSHVIKPGSNASSPTAMSRNDDPQITPIPTKIIQSSSVNAPRWVPTLVDSTLGVVVTGG